ncbi:MAG: hypothetical protein ACLSCQ_15635 [Evtepia gabavorous]
MNDTLRGCGIPAQVEETEDPLEVVVSFPGVEGSRRDLSRQRPGLRRFCPVISW